MSIQNQKKMILIVEDNKKHMNLISDVLELSGYRVLKAVDEKEAIVLLQVHSPDMVIADLLLPNLKGWELGPWITKNKKDKKIPIIYLSALLGEEGPPNEGDLGDYYMPKPFEASRLIQIIEELFAVKKVA